MSLRIMLACEDHTLDQYIARPIITTLMEELGRPRADVRPITSPRIQGIDQLRKQVCAILDRYGLISDLVVFVIDADCQDGEGDRPDRRRNFQDLIDGCPDGNKGVLVVARQELEVWALWGSRTRIKVPWNEIITECHPKERFFEPLTTSVDLKTPGKGRQRLIGLSLSQGWRSLCYGCPEIAVLQAEIKARLDL